MNNVLVVKDADLNIGSGQSGLLPITANDGIFDTIMKKLFGMIAGWPKKIFLCGK
jgi:hypothetical protein